MLTFYEYVGITVMALLLFAVIWGFGWICGVGWVYTHPEVVARALKRMGEADTDAD